MIEGEILIGSFPRARYEVFDSVNDERDRQDAKWGAQSWPDGTTQDYSFIADAYRAECDAADSRGELTWHDIAMEEFFEAMAEEDPDKLEIELIQTIAVIVNWVEDLRRKRNGH